MIPIGLRRGLKYRGRSPSSFVQEQSTGLLRRAGRRRARFPFFGSLVPLKQGCVSRAEREKSELNSTHTKGAPRGASWLRRCMVTRGQGARLRRDHRCKSPQYSNPAVQRILRRPVPAVARSCPRAEPPLVGGSACRYLVESESPCAKLTKGQWKCWSR